MANETARAVVEGDTKKAVAAMQRLADSVNRTTTVMGKAGDASKKTGSGIDQLTSMAGKAKNALGAVGLALGIKEAISMADKMAERSFALQSVMNNMTISVDKAKAQTMGLVSSFELAKSGASAVHLGVVKTGDEFGNLAEAAAKLGMAVGQDATKSVDDLIIALGRGSPKILDNLGIQLKLSDAYEEYAKRLGKTVQALSDEEKANAFRIVAMEKALAKSKEIELQVGGLAGMYQRLKVAAGDAIDSMLGGDTGVGATVEKATKAYAGMTDELKAQVDQLGTYGSAQREIEAVMRSAGIAQEDMERALKATTRAREHEIEALEQQRREQEKQAQDQHRQNLAKMLSFNIGQLEQEQKMLQAVGHQRKLSADEEIDQINEIWREKRFLAELETDHDKQQAALAKLDAEREIAIIQTVTRHEEEAAERGKKAAEKRRRAHEEATKAFQQQMDQDMRLMRERAEFEQKMLEAQHFQDFQRIEALDREVMRLESLGQDAEFVYRRRAELAAELNEALGKVDDAEQDRFEEEIRRNRKATDARREATKEAEKLAKDRAKAEADAAKKAQQATDAQVTAFSGAMVDSSLAAAKASKDKSKAFIEELQAFAFSRGRMLLIQAAYHAAQAVIAAVTFNPVKAAQEGIAAGIAAAKAAVFMTGAIIADSLGGSAGGGSSSRGSTGGPPSAVPRAGGGSGSGASSANVDQPLSPLDQERDRRVGSRGAAAAANSGGTTNVWNVNGSIVGGTPEQIGQKLIEYQEAAYRANGNLGLKRRS